MTVEEKNLLLKDLCARLPYGVKVEVKANNCYTGTCVLNACDLRSFMQNEPRNVEWCDTVTSIKPYLRPLLNLTEEEANHLSNLKITYGKDTFKWIYDNLDYLNSRHLDYRNLIEKGIALEAPVDMYDDIKVL